MDKVSLLKKVVSGGQTGVDQSALRAAVKGGLTIAGWCPPGMSSEAGLIPVEFPLTETPKERSELAPEIPRSLRTEWNVRDSDATIILQPSATNPKDLGTAFTLTSALHYQRPLLICNPNDPKSVKQIKDWIKKLGIKTLNIAGPSEGKAPGISDITDKLLSAVFAKKK